MSSYIIPSVNNLLTFCFINFLNHHYHHLLSGSDKKRRTRTKKKTLPFPPFFTIFCSSLSLCFDWLISLGNEPWASRKNFPFRLISRGASDYFESPAADLLNGFGLWSQSEQRQSEIHRKMSKLFWGWLKCRSTLNMQIEFWRIWITQKHGTFRLTAVDKQLVIHVNSTAPGRVESHGIFMNSIDFEFSLI